MIAHSTIVRRHGGLGTTGQRFVTCRQMTKRG